MRRRKRPRRGKFAMRLSTRTGVSSSTGSSPCIRYGLSGRLLAGGAVGTRLSTGRPTLCSVRRFLVPLCAIPKQRSGIFVVTWANWLLASDTALGSAQNETGMSEDLASSPNGDVFTPCRRLIAVNISVKCVLQDSAWHGAHWRLSTIARLFWLASHVSAIRFVRRPSGRAGMRAKPENSWPPEPRRRG